jgi:hypothetical protein
MIDKELRGQEIQQYTSEGKRVVAERALVSEATKTLQAFTPELSNMQSDFYKKAVTSLDHLLAMGYPDNVVTQAMAAREAAWSLGRGPSGSEQVTRRELVNKQNQALKAGVVAGAGKASVAAANKNYLQMSKEDFAAEKARLLGEA